MSGARTVQPHPHTACRPFGPLATPRQGPLLLSPSLHKASMTVGTLGSGARPVTQMHTHVHLDMHVDTRVFIPSKESRARREPQQTRTQHPSLRVVRRGQMLQHVFQTVTENVLNPSGRGRWGPSLVAHFL